MRQRKHQQLWNAVSNALNTPWTKAPLKLPDAQAIANDFFGCGVIAFTSPINLVMKYTLKLNNHCS